MCPRSRGTFGGLLIKGMRLFWGLYWDPCICKNCDLKFKALGTLRDLGFGVSGLGFRVWGLRFRV